MHRTKNVRAAVPGDSGDLLAELRNSFLAEGLEQSSTILNNLKSGQGCAIEIIQRVLHRWAGLAGTLGFPAISDQARRIEALLTQTSPEDQEIEKAIEIARQRFSHAARNKPRLPLELIAGLMGVRIGLLNFSDEEAHRMRSAAQCSNVEVVIEQMTSESIEKHMECGALVINECAISAQAAFDRPALSVPAVFIRSRSSLDSLSKLPARAYDFLIAPWDAEEVLIRVYRLLASEAPAQPADSTHLQRRRPRVLIADDDPSIVALVTETLQQCEMDCDIARSGKQALAAVRRRTPDAIVVDVNMLDLDGFEVLKQLRRNLVTKDIPVLILTARRQASDIAQAFGYGADDYVVKPFNPLELVKRVDQIMGARRKPWSPHSAGPIAAP